LVEVNDQLLQFAVKSETIFRALADSLPGPAEPGSTKERVIRLAEEAADLTIGINGSRSKAPNRAFIDLEILDEVLG
jgi:predicted RNase H-like HicB family nuclease